MFSASACLSNCKFFSIGADVRKNVVVDIGCLHDNIASVYARAICNRPVSFDLIQEPVDECVPRNICSYIKSNDDLEQARTLLLRFFNSRRSNPPPAASRAPSETLDPQGSFVTCYSDASILAIACVSTPVFKTILCTISQMFLGAHLSTGFSFKPKVTRRCCGIARAQAGVATISYLSGKTGRHAGHHSIALMMHSPRDKCDLFERHLIFLYHWLRKYLALSTVFVCAVKVRIKKTSSVT